MQELFIPTYAYPGRLRNEKIFLFFSFFMFAKQLNKFNIGMYLHRRYTVDWKKFDNKGKSFELGIRPFSVISKLELRRVLNPS